MFERFSGSSIRAIICAQEEARLLGLRQISTTLLLYGLIATKNDDTEQVLAKVGLEMPTLEAIMEHLKSSSEQSSSFIPVEIEFSETVKEVFFRAKRWTAAEVGPEQLLLVLITEPELSELLDWFKQKPSKQTVKTSMLLEPRAGQSEPITPVKPSTVETRTLRDWFSESAIEVFLKAEELATEEQNDKITADHLSRSLLPACSWLPEAVARQLGTIEQTAPLKMEQKSRSRTITQDKENIAVIISFSTEVITILMRARTEATFLGHSSIEPGHILLGVLKAYRETGDTAPQYTPEVLQDLYCITREAFTKSLQKKISERPKEIKRPLMIDKNTVLSTKRCLKTIKNSLHRTQASAGQTFEVSFIISALINSARQSEIVFVQNHEASLSEVEKTFSAACAEHQVKEGNLKKKKKAIRLEKLESILRCACAHAERLQSARLDINHLGLALLEEDDASVDAVVQAFGPKMNRECVKRRLDFCLFYQKFQPGHQSESGQEIKLSNLQQLL